MAIARTESCIDAALSQAFQLSAFLGHSYPPGNPMIGTCVAYSDNQRLSAAGIALEVPLHGSRDGAIDRLVSKSTDLVHSKEASRALLLAHIPHLSRPGRRRQQWCQSSYPGLAISFPHEEPLCWPSLLRWRLGSPSFITLNLQ